MLESVPPQEAEPVAMIQIVLRPDDSMNLLMSNDNRELNLRLLNKAMELALGQAGPNTQKKPRLILPVTTVQRNGK